MTDPVPVSEPYRDARQQHEAALFGMFIFLASEIMLFGGIFAVLAALRWMHPAEIAEASRRTHLWLGTANTFVLLTSSLAVAVAVQQARAGAARASAWLLALAAMLGLAFLGIKAFEYLSEAHEGLLPLFSTPARFAGRIDHLFMDVYLVATGLHAVHVTIGIVLLTRLATGLAFRGLSLPRDQTTIEVGGLYWHLVDAIWVVLYPLLYLQR